MSAMRLHLRRRARLLRARAIQLGPEHELDLPTAGTVTNFVVITPVQYPGQTETEPFVRMFVLVDGQPRRLRLPGRRRSACEPGTRRPAGARRIRAAERGHRRGGSHGRASRKPARMETQRRARHQRPRPPEQDLLNDILRYLESLHFKRHRDHRLGPVPDGSPHRTDRDPDADARHHGSARAAGSHAGRHRLHLSRLVRLHHGPGLLVRLEPRRDRRLAAQARFARRDGRRVGALRGVAPAPGGRHRDRRRDGLGALFDGGSRADLPDGDGSVLFGASRRGPADVRGACKPAR